LSVWPVVEQGSGSHRPDGKPLPRPRHPRAMRPFGVSAI